MPTVAVVAPHFPPRIGGVEKYAYSIARRLHDSGEYRVCIITSAEDGAERRGSLDGMPVHRLHPWFRLSNTPVNPAWFAECRRIFAQERPDLIHLHSPVPFLADIAAHAADRRIPVVLTYHAGSMAKGRWPADALIAVYEALFLPLLLRRSDAVVAVSPMVAARHRRIGAKLQVIPPGVDLREFAPTALPDRFSTVTYVGRIDSHSRWKGIEVLIDAMVEVRKLIGDARLEIVGGGDAVAHYAQQAQVRGIADIVRFSGPLVDQSLVDAYHRSSVVVLPSTSQAESFGMALIEAMACGRPVIGSRIGGIPWVLEHERNGLLVAPNDASALAEAIVRILGDRPFAARLAGAGAETAGEFDWELQVEKYRRLFGALISGRHRLAAEAGARAG